MADEDHQDEDERTEDEHEGRASTESQGLRNMLARHNNDAMTLAAELYNQTYDLREQRRQLRSEVKRLKTQVPAEGSVVLSKEEAKAWEAYQQLGEPTQLTERLTDAQKVTRESMVLKAASHHGYDQEVLGQLLGDAELEVEQKDGQPIYKVRKGDDSRPLTELVEKDWSKFGPSLTANSKHSGSGKPAVGQPGHREPGKTDRVGDYISRVQPTPKS